MAERTRKACSKSKIPPKPGASSATSIPGVPKHPGGTRLGFLPALQYNDALLKDLALPNQRTVLRHFLSNTATMWYYFLLPTQSQTGLKRKRFSWCFFLRSHSNQLQGSFSAHAARDYARVETSSALPASTLSWIWETAVQEIVGKHLSIHLPLLPLPLALKLPLRQNLASWVVQIPTNHSPSAPESGSFPFP